jgi:hypothetical protein
MDASSTHSSDTGKKVAKRMEAIFILTDNELHSLI